MNPPDDAPPDLRKLSGSELVALGEKSLREHILAQAVVAHHKYAPVTFEKLDAFLQDPECVRYPTRLVFEFGGMAMHQFGQPDVDYRNSDRNGRVLYLRPTLLNRPDLVVLAVAYLIPVVNYGDIITDEHCLGYGASLLGLMEEEYYERICQVADFVGAAPRMSPGPCPASDCA